jgi:hypothetical protein
MTDEAARKAVSEVAAELEADVIVLNTEYRGVDSKIIDKCGGSKRRDDALLLIITESSRPDPLSNTTR